MRALFEAQFEPRARCSGAPVKDPTTTRPSRSPTDRELRPALLRIGERTARLCSCSRRGSTRPSYAPPRATSCARRYLDAVAARMPSRTRSRMFVASGARADRRLRPARRREHRVGWKSRCDSCALPTQRCARRSPRGRQRRAGGLAHAREAPPSDRHLHPTSRGHGEQRPRRQERHHGERAGARADHRGAAIGIDTNGHAGA